MDNVAVVVEDRPGRVRVSSLGFAEDQELLGLYEGVPKTERAGGYHLVVPDRITLYRLPILQEVGPYASTLAVEDEIRRTIIHEVAHHFGIGDAELDRLEGRQRARR
ncbi:MAG: metallopeptidase family protein [Chloroflexi bacterium]|nr:metallopeptidase family protein [Chloroflexota bacterium]